MQVDVSNFGDLAQALRSCPKLRLVVHSAAVTAPVALLSETDPDVWRRAAEINLVGTYNVLRAALAGPLAEDGIVSHLTSGVVAPSAAKPYWSAYNASEAGAEQLIRTAANEVETSGRAICALDPEITETPMQEELRATEFPDREPFMRAYAERTYNTPEVVADAIWELSQRDRGTLNGHIFIVGAF